MSELQDVCILANRSLLGWQVEALEKMIEETGVDIPLVIVNSTENFGEPGFGRGASPLGEKAYENSDSVGLSDVKLFFKLLPYEGVWTLVLAEKKLSWILQGGGPELMERHRVEDIDVLEKAEKIHCRPVPVDGDWCDLPGNVVDQVVTETDTAIRFGFNLLTGRIITEPEYGVLSFHPADIKRYRGIGPAQPFVYDDDEAGATLQILTDELDGGNVVAIERVDISDAHTLDEIRDRVNRLQIEMLVTAIYRLRDPGFDPEPPKSLGPYTSVEKRQSPIFASKVMFKNIIGRVKSATFHEPADSG
jgi:hypothetical protein